MMKRVTTMRTVATLLAATMLSACQPAASGGIQIQEAWAGATPPGATIAAAYMTIVANDGDTLVAATTPVAASVEMHTNSEADGMMKMRPLPTAELKAGQAFEFSPGGAHFMLIGLRGPLAAGSRFPLTLRFRNAGDIVVDVKIAAPGKH